MRFLRHHLCGRVLAAEPDAAAVDAHGEIVGFVGGFVDAQGARVVGLCGDAGVVDHYVEAAVLGDCCAHDVLDRGGVACVCLDEDCIVGSEGVYGVVGWFAVVVGGWDCGGRGGS